MVAGLTAAGQEGPLVFLSPLFRPAAWAAVVTPSAATTTTLDLWVVAVNGSRNVDVYCTTTDASNATLPDADVAATKVSVRFVARQGTYTFDFNTYAIVAGAAPGVTVSLGEDAVGTFAQFETGNSVAHTRGLLFSTDIDVKAYDNLNASLTFVISSQSIASGMIIGFSDGQTVWGVSVSGTLVYPVQGLYSDPFAQDPAVVTNPFSLQYCLDLNSTVNVSALTSSCVACLCCRNKKNQCFSLHDCFQHLCLPSPTWSPLTRRWSSAGSAFPARCQWHSPAGARRCSLA